MHRTMLGGKIHRAKVTQADVAYEGSITIDLDLLEAADILPNQKVCVWDVTNGERLETYAIVGPRSTGTICVNGAAAHLVDVGNTIIIGSFVELTDAEAKTWEPSVVFVDENNRIVEKRAEISTVS